MDAPPERSRGMGKGPWLALAAVFVVPALGYAFGVPVGEWLSALTGERALPDFWLRGEKSHFAHKPKDPPPAARPDSMAFVARESRGEEPTPVSAAPPAPRPAAAGLPAGIAPRNSTPAEQAMATPPPAFRPRRLRPTGGEIRSWFKGAEVERTESGTRAFIAAEPPPAEAKPPAPATEAKPEPPPAPKDAPKPPPPSEPKRPPPRAPVPGRTSPPTNVAAGSPPRVEGPPTGPIAASGDAPRPDDAPPPPPAPAYDAYPCVVQANPERKVRLTTATEYYDVTGATADQLAAQLAVESRGGRHGPGRTIVDAHASCSFKQEGHLCTPLCTVVVSVRTRLPRWTGGGGPDVAARWKRLSSRIETHETSHKAIGVQEGNEILRRIAELARMDCREAQRTVDVTEAATRSEFAQKHRAYDATCKADPACRLEL